MEYQSGESGFVSAGIRSRNYAEKYKRFTGINTMLVELYIHIPFCIKKCHYCDFLSFPEREEAVLFSYTDALCREICLTRSAAGDYTEVSSVFIGGGTPSLLPEGCVTKILDEIRENYSLKKDAEISIEANPGTLSRNKLKEYLASGVNRLSIGLQSPDDRLLRKLGRIHSFREFLSGYRLARETGFGNINIDIMSGLPGQSAEGYEEGLRKVLDLKPDHISSYGLILEEGTPFYHDSSILSELPDEETDRLMYRRTKSILKEYGYRRYEISNYAIPGKECRHNLGYWTGVPYLGFGIGAASYLTEKGYPYPSRFSNVRDLKAYLAQPFRPFCQRPEYEILNEASCMEEYIFLGLRKMQGVSVKKFNRTFSKTMDQVYGKVIDSYLSMGLLETADGFLRLTEKGIDVSDYIFADFML